MSTLFTFSQRQKCDDQSVLCSALRKNLHCKVTVTVAECVISVAAAGEKEDRGGKNEGDDLLCFCHILSLIKRKNKLWIEGRTPFFPVSGKAFQTDRTSQNGFSIWKYFHVLTVFGVGCGVCFWEWQQIAWVWHHMLWIPKEKRKKKIN